MDFSLILQLFAFLAIARLGSSKRIVGGEITTIKDHPYQVSVRYQELHRCGGALISPSFVLTAAHCTAKRYPILMTVRAGSDFYEKGGYIAIVSNFHQHPYYNSDTYDNDISILKLATSFTLSDRIRPVNLPDQDETAQVDALSTVTGWGRTTESGDFSEHLRQAKVLIYGQEACARAYESGAVKITDRMLCAGIPEGGRDACQGDSGGPLVSGGGKLVGLVSWGRGCARPDYPGVYTRVAALREWIRTTVKV